MGTRSRRWAGTAAVVVLAGCLTALPSPANSQDIGEPWTVVVKVDAASTCSSAPATKYAVEHIDTLLESRRVYLVQSADPAKRTTSKADDLARKLSGDSCVVYAERNRQISVDDNRFHAWPSGQCKPSSEEEWRDQPSAGTLGLDEAQSLSRGAGVKVAVLDTGVDASHPQLAGAVLSGWDYLEDDADTSEVSGGSVSGHGTFIAGVVHLVAPDATIIPMRVLSPDGLDGYRIAEAIRDAVAMGARVINLSLGTRDKIESKVLTEAIKYARSRGVLTTAAAGNDGDELQHWPAAQPEVVSVAALDPTNVVLATYSTRGDWVDFATIGTDLISLMPTGGYDSWSGTSMATPLVSGQLALIIAAAPRLDAAHVEEQVRATARKLTGQKLHYGGVSIAASIRRALR